MLPKEYATQDCSIARALEIVGERWTVLVLRDAFTGVRRFGDFAAHLDIPRAVLSDRLNELVDRGVLERRRYSERPPREEYVLTERGVALWPVLYSLAYWGDSQFRPEGGPRRLYRHADCGTHLDAHGACPECGGVVAAADIEVAPGPGLRRRRTDRISVALSRPHRLLVPL